MNPRMRKEMRQMAPGFWLATLGMLVMVTSQALFWWSIDNVWGRTQAVSTARACGIIGIPFGWFSIWYGSHWMGASVFGAEFLTGTLQGLLAQPRARREIWADKMRPLAILTAASLLLAALGGVLAAAAAAAIPLTYAFDVSFPADAVVAIEAAARRNAELGFTGRFADLVGSFLANHGNAAAAFAMLYCGAILCLAPFCALVMRKTHFSVLLAGGLEMAFLVVSIPVIAAAPQRLEAAIRVAFASPQTWYPGMIFLYLITPLWLAVMAGVYCSARRTFLRLEA